MNVSLQHAKLLRQCAKNTTLREGRQIHALLEKHGLSPDLTLCNDLIHMYVRCSRLDVAAEVFDKMPCKNVVSWTTLICGQVQAGEFLVSVHLFQEMRRYGVYPNEYTLSTIVKACAAMGDLDEGMQIHGICFKIGNEATLVVANSILDMYSKCGRITDAGKVFDFMFGRNIVTWNTMISAHTRGGNSVESLVLFREMRRRGEILDAFTFTAVLKACSVLGERLGGMQVHCFLVVNGLTCNVHPTVAGALVDLYVKCKNLRSAQKVFDRIDEKNLISWSSLMLGYAQNGDLRVAMAMFSRLRNENILVDGHVLSGIISVFADLAFVEQGRQMHAHTIKTPHVSDKSVFNSIIDMYLKCGLLEEAEQCFRSTPFKNVISWTTMITGYGKYGHGRKVVKLFEKMKEEKSVPDEVTHLAILSAFSHSGLVEESKKHFSEMRRNPRIKLWVEHYCCMVDVLGRAGRLREAMGLIRDMPFEPNVGIWQTLLGACGVHGNIEIGSEVNEILLRLDGENPVNYVMMSNVYAAGGRWRECEELRRMVREKGMRKKGGCSWVEVEKKVHYFYGGDDTHPLIGRIHEILREMEKRMKEEIGYSHSLSFALHDVEEESKEECLLFHSEKLAVGLALVCGGLENEGRIVRIFKNLRVCGDCHEFIKGLSRILGSVFLVRDASRFHRFESGSCSCGNYW